MRKATIMEETPGDFKDPSPFDNVSDGLTVQQTAELTGLSEHNLRYYERVGLIRPVRRHASSKHRRYSSLDVAKIETLSCLRAAAMPLEQMRRYFELMEQGADAAPHLQELLKEQRVVLQRKIEQMRSTMEYLEHKIAYWEAIEEGDREKSETIQRELRAFLKGDMGPLRIAQKKSNN
jgi:DNA-binding transcriptional MerR regulator